MSITYAAVLVCILCGTSSFLGTLMPAQGYSPKPFLPESSASSQSAQSEKPTSEKGSILLGIDGGWSFGLPAVQASAQAGNVYVASPEKKTLPAYSALMGVRAWRFLIPFVELAAFDTGKATAQVGTVQSQVQANTFAINGGVRAMGSSARLRPYLQVGGGLLRQNASGTFVANGFSYPVSNSDSAATGLYGGGVQYYIGRRWGTDVGFDGFWSAKAFNTGGRNFAQVRIGWFFQTKSSRK